MLLVPHAPRTSFLRGNAYLLGFELSLQKNNAARHLHSHAEREERV